MGSVRNGGCGDDFPQYASLTTPTTMRHSTVLTRTSTCTTHVSRSEHLLHVGTPLGYKPSPLVGGSVNDHLASLRARLC